MFSRVSPRPPRPSQGARASQALPRPPSLKGLRLALFSQLQYFCQHLSDARRAAVPIGTAGATPSTHCRRQIAAILNLPIEAHASDRTRNYFETLGEHAEKPIPAQTNTQAPGNTKRRVASASCSSSMFRPQSSSMCGDFQNGNFGRSLAPSA